MLHTYILNKETLSKYFPEVGNTNTDSSVLVENTELVCVQSNRWIDIEEKDRYIPFTFRTDQPLTKDQEELVVKYLEKQTNSKDIFLILIRKMGVCYCEYRCLISPISELNSGNSGGNVLYTTEKDSYHIKQKISLLEKNKTFLSLDHNCGEAHPESTEVDGVWMIPSSECSVEDRYTVDNHIVAGKILNLTHQNGIFTNLGDIDKQMVSQIGDKKLPSVKIPKTKIISLVNRLIKTEDPLYTPVKLRDCLKNGVIHFYDKNKFMSILSNVKNEDVEVSLTKKPVDTIILLRENSIPFVATQSGPSEPYEIIYHKQPAGLGSIDFNIDDVILAGCKNHQDIMDHSDMDKLDTMIIDGHGITTKEGDIMYKNPGTGKLLPFNIIHSLGTYKNGLDIPGINYDPHKNVDITIPMEVVIDVIDDCHISICIKTDKEEVFLCEKVKMSHRPAKIELLRYLIRKLWKKGYLFNDYGLSCAHHHNVYETGCIQKPWWFLSDIENDKISPESKTSDLIDFISNL